MNCNFLICITFSDISLKFTENNNSDVPVINITVQLLAKIMIKTPCTQYFGDNVPGGAYYIGLLFLENNLLAFRLISWQLKPMDFLFYKLQAH